MRRTFRVTAASVLATPAVLLLAPAAHATEPDACVVAGSVLTVTGPSGTGTILGQSGGAITLKTGDPNMPTVAGCTNEGFPISVASLTSIVLQDDGDPDAEPSSFALETDTGFGAAVVTIKTEPTDKAYLLSSDATLPTPGPLSPRRRSTSTVTEPRKWCSTPCPSTPRSGSAPPTTPSTSPHGAAARWCSPATAPTP